MTDAAGIANHANSGQPAPGSHRHRIRVRYAETDQMGVAHHAAFVVWLEEARIEWLRHHQLSYRDLEARGILMPVVELAVRYRRSLRFDDSAELTTTCAVRSPTRVVFASRLEHEGVLCAEAEVTVAAVGRDGRPQRLPAEVVAALGG